MTLPDERTQAVVETRRFLTSLLSNRRVPAEVRGRALTLLRHYPNSADMFYAGWQELADPRLVLEPVFGMSADGSRSPGRLPPTHSASE